MANAQKGEFALTMGGTVYTLKLGTSALIELQELLGTPEHAPTMQELVIEVVNGRAKYIRAFIWAGLRKYHPEVTLEAVSDLLDDTSEAEAKAVLRALGVSTQPDTKDVQALGLDTVNPQPAQTGPRSVKAPRRGGGRSTSARAAQV